MSPRIALLEQRAAARFVFNMLGGTVTECDLVAKVVQNGSITGYFVNPAAGNFAAGDGITTLSDAALRALATVPGQEVTYPCVPPGSGT